MVFYFSRFLVTQRTDNLEVFELLASTHRQNISEAETKRTVRMLAFFKTYAE